MGLVGQLWQQRWELGIQRGKLGIEWWLKRWIERRLLLLRSGLLDTLSTDGPDKSV
jgi:hypothetical protein